MFRYLLVFIFLVTTLIATDKIEVFATTMDTSGDIVYASGEVNVIYKDYFISAEEAKYNRKSGDLELFTNIRVTQGTSYKILGNYAKLNIKNKTREFKPFYMLEKDSNLWVSGEKGIACDKDLDVDSGVLSGCNPLDPLWKIQFSSSTYNEESQWFNMYNARLYIYDIPIFYTPYFGYSLDDRRQSGLLIPSAGISSDEGFYYEQPIYFAPQDWWDLELKPQIRTSRGSGLYSTFRFVDSTTSRGSLTLGYFKEKDSYFKDKKLANQEHLGFDFDYDNNDFLNQWFGTSFSGQSAIYADIHYLNDVDYLNLSTNDTTTTATATQVLSRINLLYNNDNNYFGSYFKYYQDLTLTDNDVTLQKLPTFQYHRYLDTILENHLLYNLDLQSTNIYRTEGVGAVQTNLSVPITLQSSIFDEYINVAYKAYLYAQSSVFNGVENTTKNDYKDGYYARNYNVVQASTQVTRAFENYTHNMGFRTSYVFSGAESRDGYYKDQENFCSKSINKSDPRCDFYSISDINEALNLEFTQYLFDSSGSTKLYHKISQNIVYQQDSNESLGDLENEIDYKLTSSISLYNNAFYNYDENLFSKVYSKISYVGNGLTLSLSHLYKEDVLKALNASDRFTKYVTSDIGYTYDEHYSYKAIYNYDLQNSLKKTAEIGFLYKKRCWDFGIRYVENNRPVLTNTGTYNSIFDRYIYFTILLKPIMQSNVSTDSAFSYKLPEIYKGE